jgi:hypothetical protein
VVVYKVFYKDYELKKGEFVGLLVERRRNLRGKSQLESGLRWARLMFGHTVKDERAIFIVPDELKQRSDTEWVGENRVFTRWDLLGMVRPIDQEIRAKRKGGTLP